MTYPYFAKGLTPAGGQTRAEEVPTLERTRMEDPKAYIPHPDLSHAVNVALILGMPLLVTGEPGTGKTQLASVIADTLACPLHKFEVKSTSQARDLFYTYDAISAFKMKVEMDQRVFIRYSALGCAILDAFPSKRVGKLLPPQGGDYVHNGPRRAVVLMRFRRSAAFAPLNTSAV